MKVATIRTGYVGLVSGVCFFDFGHDLVCVDKVPEKIVKLDRDEVPIYEPGLDKLMEKYVVAGRLSFTSIWRARWTGRTRCSSPWARRCGAVTGTRT